MLKKKMMPGENCYTPEEVKQHDDILRVACEAEEEIDLDELESYSCEMHIKSRELLKKHNIPFPDESLGLINELRWAASDNQWYLETVDGKVYWYSGKKGWKICSQGYPWVTGRYK
jgi:hypothetical protein